jgi:hypothetical protein
MFFKKKGIKFCYTVENLYKSIPRKTAAVLKAKGGPAPY